MKGFRSALVRIDKVMSLEVECVQFIQFLTKYPSIAYHLPVTAQSDGWHMQEWRAWKLPLTDYVTAPSPHPYLGNSKFKSWFNR